jgi:hypothetical protein
MVVGSFAWSFVFVSLGFIMVGRGPEGAEVRRRVAALQSPTTVGLACVPLVGMLESGART